MGFFLLMVSNKIIKILKVYKESKDDSSKVSEDDETKIKVNEFTSKIAFVYEKLRNTLDYKEEHLLRKNAVERIISRSFWEIKNNPLAEDLLKELIRAGYLPNNAISEYKIIVIDAIFQKYYKLLIKIKEQKTWSEFNKFQKWILDFCACEIESNLYNSQREQALVEAMYRSLESRVQVANENFSDAEKDLQLYIAVNKALVRSDNKMIGFLVFKSFYPEWLEAPDNEFINEIASRISKIKEDIDKEIKNPLSAKFFSICKKQAIYYKVLEGVIVNHLKNIDEIFNIRDRFEDETRETAEINYDIAKKKFRTGLVRSIVYILITKVVIALLVEVPLDLYIFHGFSYTTIGINVTFPPILMLLVGLSIRLPSEKNTSAIVSELVKIVYNEEDTSPIVVKPSRKRSKFTLFFFGLLYLTTYVVTFGLIVLGLIRLHFSIPSGVIFILFLCIVSFFAVRVKTTAKEWVVLKTSQRFFATIFDFFFMPIIKVGRWLSLEFSKINIFMFILDFIIEAPFKTFLSIFEDWMSYVREKKDEIY